MPTDQPSLTTSRIGLIGPVWPYRGGIAHYTTLLKRTWEDDGTMPVVVSFKSQYPSWLYPGQSDREPDSQGASEPGVAYLLSPFSPLSWIRAADHLAESGCTHVVLSWWTLFWAPALAFIARRLRGRAIKVVFLCHNLADHGSQGVKARLSHYFLAQADGYVVHASEQAKALHGQQPGKPLLQRIHPIYTHFPTAASPPAARGRLEVLFFGFLRPYKGLESLLQAVIDLDDPELYLTIAGEPWGSTQYLDDARRRLGERMETHLGYVPATKAAELFCRADLVALPYLSATGSGVAALAYHYRKPVLASRVGGLVDSVDEDKTGWLVPPASPTALAATLARLDRATASSMASGISHFVEQNSWPEMASAIASFIRTLPTPTHPNE